MSALSYFLEDEGIATTGISLVREHTEQMQPPRALWVPFPLGRPLGVPGDPAFQLDVIHAALALLDASSGPVLVDYERDAPASLEPETEWACPVSFAQAEDNDDSLGARVRREVRDLAPWYDVSRERLGRTTVGASGLGIDDCVGLVERALDTDDIDAITFKYAIEDLKAYYLEAGGVTPGADIEINAWLWRETALTDAFRSLFDKHQDSNNTALKELMHTGFIPRGFA